MKTLCLLRHAKAGRIGPGADIDRPLTARGRAACATMAAHLLAGDLAPDLVLCSPAARTRETLHHILDETGWAPPVEYPAALYPGAAERVLEQIGMADDAVARLLVVGHNPGIQLLALALTGPDGGDAARHIADKYPTAGLAVLDFDGPDWSAIAPRRGRLRAFVTPATLAGG
jgi:phosphohistidine phosphatase